MTLSFLASVLLKHLSGQRPDDEVLEKLRQLAGEYVTEVPTEEPKSEEEPKEVPEKKVRKIKSKVEHAMLKPVDMDMEEKVEKVEAGPTLEIVEENCRARKEGDVLPDTEGAKVYREKQCPKKAQKGESLCKVCARMEEAHKESKGKDKKWLGRVGEPLPAHAHMVGSAWFREKYPKGLAGSEEVVEAPQESVMTSEAVKEILWVPLMHDGMAMIRNVKNRNVYKADTEQEGEEMILWSEFVGKWRDGEIDYYAEENDDEE